MDLTPPLLLGLAAVYLLAGAVKGVTGLGLPTVAMALGTLLLPPAAAAGLLLLPSLATNLWQGLRGPALRPLLRRLWPLLLGIALGAAAGGDRLAAGGAEMLLGTVLLLYAFAGLALPAFGLGETWARRLALPVGLATGFLTAATGVFVLPLVPYLQALRLERDALVQAMGLGFAVATLALGGLLAATAALPAELMALSFAALLPALAGLWLGQRLRRRLSPARFRQCLLLALGALGMNLLLR